MSPAGSCECLFGHKPLAAFSAVPTLYELIQRRIGSMRRLHIVDANVGEELKSRIFAGSGGPCFVNEQELGSHSGRLSTKWTAIKICSYMHRTISLHSAPPCIHDPVPIGPSRLSQTRESPRREHKRRASWLSNPRPTIHLGCAAPDTDFNSSSPTIRLHPNPAPPRIPGRNRTPRSDRLLRPSCRSLAIQV